MDMWTEYLRKYTHVFWSEWVTSVNMYRGLTPLAGTWSLCEEILYGWFLLLCCGGNLMQPWGGSWVEDDSEEVQCCWVGSRQVKALKPWVGGYQGFALLRLMLPEWAQSECKNSHIRTYLGSSPSRCTFGLCWIYFAGLEPWLARISEHDFSVSRN